MGACTAALALAILLTSPVAAQVGLASGDVLYVTDGDTFRLTNGERIRIAGIDAPETHADHARCAEELQRGAAAWATAKELLSGKTLTFR